MASCHSLFHEQMARETTCCCAAVPVQAVCRSQAFLDVLMCYQHSECRSNHRPAEVAARVNYKVRIIWLLSLRMLLHTCNVSLDAR